MIVNGVPWKVESFDNANVLKLRNGSVGHLQRRHLCGEKNKNITKSTAERQLTFYHCGTVDCFEKTEDMPAKNKTYLQLF